ELMDCGAHGLGIAFEDRFAPADDTVVRLDSAEEPPRWNQERLNSRHLHRSHPSDSPIDTIAPARPDESSGVPVDTYHIFVQTSLTNYAGLVNGGSES